MTVSPPRNLCVDIVFIVFLGGLRFVVGFAVDAAAAALLLPLEGLLPLPALLFALVCAQAKKDGPYCFRAKFQITR